MQYDHIAAYEGPESYVFISYAHKDTAAVFPIIDQLCSRGYRIWYDDGIIPGSEWPEDIARHLDGSAMVIAFITPNSMASVNCRREINFALSRQKPFLSVVLEPTEMPLGMELQLSAQQSVLRYSCRSEEAFIDKICDCPAITCCLEPPAEPEPAQEPEPIDSTPAQEEAPPPEESPVSQKATSKKTNKTGIVILVVALAVILAGLCFVFAPTSEFVIHAQVPESWENVGLWAWSEPDSREAFDAWPGELMLPDGNGWYTATVPSWVNSIILNGSYGAVQTEDIAIESRELWITVNKDLSWQISYEDPQAGTVTVHVSVPADWKNPHCWAWSDSGDVFDEWPGGKLTKHGDWYIIDIPEDTTGILVNANGGSIQTGDFRMEAGWDVWVVVRDGGEILFYEKPTEADFQDALKTLVPGN